MTQQTTTASKKQPNTPRYTKEALQIAIWLIFGVIAFSIPWADLLLPAAFLLAPVACYAAVIYHFDTQQTIAKNELSQTQPQ